MQGTGGRRRNIVAPTGLSAWRFDLGEDAFLLLEWRSSLAPPARFASLSPGEADVVTLAAAGLSNEAIARRRRSATRTVANQIGSAFRKLGIHSRSELIAGFAARQTPGER